MAVVVAAADETSYAEPRQARQADQGMDSHMALDIVVMSAWVRQSTHNLLWI